MLNYKNSHLHITATNGILSVINTDKQTLTLEEKSLSQFEKFYNYWNLAFHHAKDDIFVNNWLHNAPFKKYLTKSFEALGFNDFETLTVTQLEALLLGVSEGDKQTEGLIFRLHNTYPKLTTL